MCSSQLSIYHSPSLTTQHLILVLPYFILSLDPIILPFSSPLLFKFYFLSLFPIPLSVCWTGVRPFTHPAQKGTYCTLTLNCKGHSKVQIKYQSCIIQEHLSADRKREKGLKGNKSMVLALLTVNTVSLRTPKELCGTPSHRYKRQNY